MHNKSSLTSKALFEENLKKANIVLIYTSKEFDSTLVSYYTLCKAIFGNALQEDKPEILLNALKGVITNLPSKEAKALKLRFGIHSTPHTYAQIGEIMDISRTTATNLCNKAIRRLRHYSRSVLYNLRIQEKANSRINKQ